MKLGYTREEVVIALNEMDTSLFKTLETPEAIDALIKFIGGTREERDNLSWKNKTAALEHGISVTELINSPNYDSLMRLSAENQVRRLVKYYENKGLTNIQACGVVALLAGVLK